MNIILKLLPFFIVIGILDYLGDILRERRDKKESQIRELSLEIKDTEFFKKLAECMEACLEQFVEWHIKFNEEIEIPSTMIFSDTTQIKTSKHKIIIHHNKLGKDKLSKEEIKAITSALLGEEYYAEVTLGVSVIKPSDIKWNNIVNKVRNE